MEKNRVKALTTDRAVMLPSGIASGKRVTAHIIVKIYRFPLLVLGSGPTQSIMMRANGSPIAGIGYRGAGGIVWLDSPAI